MRRVLLILFLHFFITNYLSAQTVFWTETFGTGCNDSNLAGGTITSNGTWNLTNTGFNDQEANTWYISASEQNPGGGGCSGGCGGTNNRSLHVGPVNVVLGGFGQVIAPDGGARYSAQGVNFPATTDRRIESPIINCTGQSTITVNLNYLENGDGTNDNGEVWYFDGTAWSLLQDPVKTTCCGGACTGLNQGIWATFTAALPVSADNNPNVKIGFHWINNDDGIGTDPSFGIDDITLSGTSAALPLVGISPSPNDTICQSATLTLNGSAQNGPITAWSWSVTPSAGVSINTPAAQNTTVTFASAGTYSLTLTATNGSGNGDTTLVVTVLPMIAPTVTISANPVNPVCAGTTINFTATPTNGGTAPSYQWQVNSVNAGSNSPNFSSVLNNNDVVTVTVTSNAQCLSTPTGADSYTVVIAPTVVPTVTITADDSSICAGTTVNFTATSTNGGVAPAYQWTINGADAGGNSAIFSSATLNNNDTVRVILTSNVACPNPATATSGSILIVVTPTVVPSVSLSAAPSGTLCLGQAVSFTATPTNGGTIPAYQWQVNGTNVGSNSPNFSSSTLNNGDTVKVTLTSNAVCATPDSAIATYIVQVIAPQAPSVIVTPNPIIACAGSSITFTATPTNGGTAPSYQWSLNGSNVGANSSGFTLSNISGGEQVSVVLTSNAACITIATVSSNTVTVSALPNPTITISQGTATVCPNEPDTIIVSATAGSIFTWSPAAGLNATNNDTVVATNLIIGVYTYFITADLAGCKATDSVKVTVFNGLIAVAGPPLTICFGKSDSLTVSGGTSWQWTPAGSLGCDTCMHTLATPTVTTTYTVVTSLGACTDTVTETITVIPNASASFNTSIVSPGLPSTVNFANTSTNATAYDWTFGNGSGAVIQNPSATYNFPGTYTVVLIAYGTNGCNDTLQTTLIIADSVGVVIPNVFTPNGDNINDVWKPSVHGVTSLECTIYNRWGLLVYEFAGIEDHWDGYTTGGLFCQDGTYYYILKATDRNNKAYDLKGFLQLFH